MFAIIKNEKIIGFTDFKPTEENMLFDEIIEGGFDTSKSYKFENGEVVENIISPIEKTNEEVLKELETQLLELSAKITGLKQLIDNGLNTEDDLVLLEKIQLQAKDLAEQRKILKTNS